MGAESLIAALNTLRSEIERGEDVYEAPPMVYDAAREFGGQQLLTGNQEQVEQLLAALPAGVEPELVFEFFMVGLLYANDGGQGLRNLSATWEGSENPYKAYIASHQRDLTLE